MHTINTFKTAAIAAAIAVGSLACAVHAQDTAPRQQRMDEALQNYRDSVNKNPQPGPAARAEEATKRGVNRAGNAVRDGAERTGNAVKHGAQRAGNAIKRGAEKTGDAIGTGMEKTGNAVRRGGEKLKDGSNG